MKKSIETKVEVQPISNNEVLLVQQKLNKIEICKIEENGILNDETIKAIKLLQNITGFEQNGIIDQNLWFRINEILTWDEADKTRTFAVIFDKWKKENAVEKEELTPEE